MTLSILGNNFLPNSTVSFRGRDRAAISTPDATHLTIALTASELTGIGTYPVVVTNPAGDGGPAASNDIGFSVLDPNMPQPAVTSLSTTQKLYAAGDWFSASYSTMAGAASGVFDLMITVTPLATGNTYYYFDDPSDSNNEWLHTTSRSVRTGTPQTGNFNMPSFQVSNDVPSGDYHMKAYFSNPGADQPTGVAAEADFTVSTDAAPGGCFVATAAFGTPMARQVQALRKFRDRILLSATTGRWLVNWYYSWSPRAAAWLSVHAVARKWVRAILWIPVAFAWSSLRTGIGFASLAFAALLLVLGRSLHYGPAWWRWCCLVALALGILFA